MILEVLRRPLLKEGAGLLCVAFLDEVQEAMHKHLDHET
jgi:hypothetical protein